MPVKWKESTKNGIGVPGTCHLLVTFSMQVSISIVSQMRKLRLGKLGSRPRIEQPVRGSACLTWKPLVCPAH